MAWFKVDDKFREHRKVRAIGRRKVTVRADVAAAGLWTIAGNWSADNLEDGFVPSTVVEDYDPKHAIAAHLVRVGLWQEATKHGEPGYQFHDWDDWQPTRDQVDARRRADAERKARWRASRTESQQSHGGTDTVTHAGPRRDSHAGRDAGLREESVLPDPTRPDPNPLTTPESGDRYVTLPPADATEHPPEPPPPARPADARCTAHQGIADPPPCNGCRAARERAESLADRETDRAARDRERRARDCRSCDGVHIVDAQGKPTRQKCDHRRTA